MTSYFAERMARPHYVYRLYDEAMVLLYVGCTYNVHKRLNEHRSVHRKTWFPRVATVRATAYPDGTTAYQAEALAHEQESPLCSGNPWTPLFTRADAERVKAEREQKAAS